MIPVLNLLAMGGGQKPIEQDGNTVFFPYQDDILHVIRGIGKTLTVSIDTNGSKRVSINYSLWLPEGVSIASSTWETEHSTSLVTLASDSSDSQSTEVYVSGTTRNTEIFIKNTIVTDQSPVAETVSNSILIRTLRYAA